MVRRSFKQTDCENINGVWIHPTADLGNNVSIEPGAVIGADVTVGDDCWIGPNAVIYGPCVLGARNKVFPGAFIGGPPQDLSYAGEPTRVEIGDENTFREGVTVHRGTIKGGGVTRIGNSNFLMANSHIGHDCQLGDSIVLTNDCLIAGHCHIQDNVYMAGRVAIVQFTTVGRHAFITGLSGTTMDVEPFLSHRGIPARANAVNSIGLRRAGFPNRTIVALKEAFKLLFGAASKGGVDFDDIRHELERREMLCEEVDELLTFMLRSTAGRHGRMLQSEEPTAQDELAGYQRRWAGSLSPENQE